MFAGYLVLLDDKLLQAGDDRLDLTVVRMDRKLDRLGQIQADDAHDRLRVDDIPAGDQVEITLKLRSHIHKTFYFVDGI